VNAGTKHACRDILEHIAAYLDGELEATACLSIEAHCGECDACARVVSGLRETVGLCRQAASAPLPDGVRALARARVRRMLETGTVPSPSEPSGFIQTIRRQ
jgi:anti-sigma factor RsiW